MRQSLNKTEKKILKRTKVSPNLQKENSGPMAKSFYNSGFVPSEKNFKSISMFDFGTKYGVSLGLRSKGTLGVRIFRFFIKVWKILVST